MPGASGGQGATSWGCWGVGGCLWFHAALRPGRCGVARPLPGPVAQGFKESGETERSRENECWVRWKSYHLFYPSLGSPVASLLLLLSVGTLTKAFLGSKEDGRWVNKCVVSCTKDEIFLLLAGARLPPGMLGLLPALLLGVTIPRSVLSLYVVVIIVILIMNAFWGFFFFSFSPAL